MFLPNEKETECRDIQNMGLYWMVVLYMFVDVNACFQGSVFWNLDHSTTCSFYSLQYRFSLKHFAWKTNAATRLWFWGRSRLNCSLKLHSSCTEWIDHWLQFVLIGDSITRGTPRTLKYRSPVSIWPTIWKRWMETIRNSRTSWRSWLVAGFQICPCHSKPCKKSF